MLKFDASDFIAKTNQIAENLQRSSEEITHFGALEVWRKSQQIVPVDTRLLKSTGYLATKATGVRATVEIGYGGPSPDLKTIMFFTRPRKREIVSIWPILLATKYLSAAFSAQ